MTSKYICFLIITVYLIITPVSSTKDLILGRSYIVPAETYEETFNLLRLGDTGTNVQQILYVVFNTIQTVISIILNLVCSSITPITDVVEALRGSVLESIISIVDLLVPVITAVAPQVALVLQVIQLVLGASNQLLYNGTIIIQEYGCTTILSINNVVSSIVNAIVGVF
ncbi:uncharacterized protein LOC108905611 [Anoplophora glabripennis]|uniref:uncharacterized protein LOC108905611 n=1 Tax=Anoplophora glabripennis TaxID=217634 RepID=UPI0008747CEB|nr:uncharacterized protein LOC108905611 [Anoplophora glabripennis]